MDTSTENIMEEVRGTLTAIVREQNSRLTEVTKRQDGMISAMSNELSELRRMVQKLQGGSSS